MPDRPFSSFFNRMATFSSCNVFFFKKLQINIMNIKIESQCMWVKVIMILGKIQKQYLIGF